MNAQRRIEEQIFELHLLVAEELERRPDEVMLYARRLLARWRAINGDDENVRTWQSLLEQGPSVVLDIIRERSERATLLRSVSPFGSFLQAQRHAVFSRSLR